MGNNKTKISLFKPYLDGAAGYKGGKTLQEIASDKKIYKLSSNENPIGSSPKAVAAIKANLENLHLYPDRTDIRLRQALEQFYKNELQADQFIAASSGSEILELIIRGFTEHGLEIIVSNPCFSIYKMFGSWNGATAVDVPLKAPNFSLDVEGILNAINDNTRIIFLTSPNNPTGTYLPKKDLDRLIDQVPEHVVVILDEVYFQFADADDYTNAMPYVKAGKQVIGVNSFSKSYGLAALRLGYCYSTPKITNYLRNLCKPFMINILSLEAAIAALEDSEFIKKTTDLVKAERPFLYKALDELKVNYWPSQSNFILIKPEMDALEFENKMFAEGIMVRPVANFGAPGCVRVTIGTREANEAYIAALAKIVG